MKTKLCIGDRVLLKKPHGNAGCEATYVEDRLIEKTGGKLKVVMIETGVFEGMYVYITSSEEYTIIKHAEPTTSLRRD